MIVLICKVVNHSKLMLFWGNKDLERLNYFLHTIGPKARATRIYMNTKK